VAAIPPPLPQTQVQYASYHGRWKPPETSSSAAKVGDACALLALATRRESGAGRAEGGIKEGGGEGDEVVEVTGINAAATVDGSVADQVSAARTGAQEADAGAVAGAEVGWREGARLGKLAYVMRRGLPLSGRRVCAEDRPFVSGLEVEVISKHKIGRRLLFAVVAPVKSGTLSEEGGGGQEEEAWAGCVGGGQVRTGDEVPAQNAMWTPWVWSAGVAGLGSGVEPFALQLVLGKTLTELSSDAEAGHIMSCMRVGDRVRVSGRLQPQDGNDVTSPRPDQIDLIVHDYHRISRASTPSASPALSSCPLPTAPSALTPSSRQASSHLPEQQQAGGPGPVDGGAGELVYFSELDPRRVLIVRNAEEMRVAVQALLLSLGRLG
jgi:hypothetical protein